MFKSIFAIALTVLMLPFQAHALGLGEMKVSSSLYQQFEARIEVTSVSPEDAENIIVKLATREEFRKKDIERPMALDKIKFMTVIEGTEIYIRITSHEIIRDPVVRFLLDVDWPEGRFLREYGVTLVPPVVL